MARIRGYREYAAATSSRLAYRQRPRGPGHAPGHGGSLAARRRPNESPSYRASTRLSPLLIIGVTGLATGAALAICPPLLTVLLATCASLPTPLHPLRLRLGS
jgi:hypothetical protein